MPPQQTELTSEATGPPVTPIRSLSGRLQACWQVFVTWRRRQRSLVGLRELSERQLRDIGLTQGDVDRIEARRAIERLRDGRTYL